MADDTLALLSRAEAYAAINDPTTATAVSSDRDAEVIAIWVPAVSRRIDELCGPVVVRTVSDERHDGGVHVVELVKSPALSVTTLVEYAAGVVTTLTAEQDATLPDDGYVLETVGSSTFVYRRSGGGNALFAYGRQNVKATYQAGRYATTAAVDAKFKMCAGAIMRRLWSRESSMWSSGGDPFAELGAGTSRFYKTVDPMVAEFLPGELRAPAVA